MIKTDNKGNVVACITTKEDLDYTNFDKETIKYYEEFLIPSYEELSDKQNKEIERLNDIIDKLEQENAVLKTQVVNKDKYSYGIRMGSDKEWVMEK